MILSLLNAKTYALKTNNALFAPIHAGILIRLAPNYLCTLSFKNISKFNLLFRNNKEKNSLSKYFK
nr:hypothetical protein [uncultured bacterium]